MNEKKDIKYFDIIYGTIIGFGIFCVLIGIVNSITNLPTLEITILAVFFITGNTFFLTIIDRFIHLKNYQVEASEKRLEKFYLPTKEFIEGIKASSCNIENNYTDKIKELKEIIRYEYLAKEKTRTLFKTWTDKFMQNPECIKKNIDTDDLLCKLKDDIKGYENIIAAHLDRF